MSDGPTPAAVRAGLVAGSAVDAEAPLVRAFKAWALGIPDDLPGLVATAAEGFAAPTDRAARHVAVLGYAAAAGSLEGDARPVLEAGLRWLGARRWNQPFREPTLEVDGVAMLGVALGARGFDRALAAPLAALAAASAGLPDITPFNRSLMAAASHVFEAPGRPDLATLLPEARVALADLGLVPDDPGTQVPAWHNAMRHLPREGEQAQTVLTLRAFDALCERNMPARLGRLEPDDVVRVLNGVARSLQGWTWEERPRTKTSSAMKWDVENEYHVQNLLWAILAPLFPDLHAEEYTPPVGHKNPRMDLTIPSMGLVVEIKFVRVGVRFADIIEEVAADASLYRTDPKWRVLVPFIWDDSRRSEDHATLIGGLRQLEMVHDAVVVSRPGKMERTAKPAVRKAGARPRR